MTGVVAPPRPAEWAEADQRLGARRRSLTTTEAQVVVARNNVGCVRYALSDCATRITRVRYARHANALYIPAWTSLDLWYESAPPELECDVSEVEGRSCWRYVWLRGRATPLHPTGVARDRQEWRQAILILRQAIPNMPPTDELAMSNFGVVRMDIESVDGAIVPWE